MKRKLALLMSLFTAVALIPGVAAAQPGNDDLGSATPVTAVPFEDSVATGEATVEEGEPTETCAPFAYTVWYALTVDSTTDVFIDTAGSNYDTAIAVWVGTSFDNVELVACNDDTFQGLQAATTVTAEAGTTYLVQIGAFLEAPADALLNVRFGDPPKNTGKPFIEKDTFRGSDAQAYVEEFDEETGTFSSRSVSIVDGRQQSKGSRPDQFTGVFVDSFSESFDETTETFTTTSWFGFADLDPSQFTLDNRLRNAAVTAEVVLIGETCTSSPEAFECVSLGETVVQVDVGWTGFGSTVRVRENSSTNVDGLRLRFRGNGTVREASIIGGVDGSVGFDLTGAEGSIANRTSGSWLWLQGLGTSGLTGAQLGTSGFIGPEAALSESGLQVSQLVFDRFRGEFANAFNEQFDEETGEFSFQDVALIFGRTKAKGERWIEIPPVTVSSFTQRFDQEQGTVTFTQWFGSGPVTEGSVDRRLDGATVQATVTVFGTTCTERFIQNGEEPDIECTDLGESTVVVDVDWVGSGPISANRFGFSLMSDVEHIRFSGRSSGRAAVANGSVSGDLVGWTFEDAPGELGRSAEGSWMKG